MEANRLAATKRAQAIVDGLDHVSIPGPCDCGTCCLARDYLALTASRDALAEALRQTRNVLDFICARLRRDVQPFALVLTDQAVERDRVLLSRADQDALRAALSAHAPEGKL